MLNPAFKVNNLQSMVVVFDEKAKLLAKVINCLSLQSCQ
jgi:hypothetical protein